MIDEGEAYCVINFFVVVRVLVWLINQNLVFSSREVSLV